MVVVACWNRPSALPFGVSALEACGSSPTGDRDPLAITRPGSSSDVPRPEPAYGADHSRTLAQEEVPRWGISVPWVTQRIFRWEGSQWLLHGYLRDEVSISMQATSNPTSRGSVNAGARACGIEPPADYL